MNNIEKAKLGTIGAITTFGIVGLPQMEAEAQYRYCPPVIRHERRNHPINHRSIQESRQEYYKHHRNQQNHNSNYDQREHFRPQRQYENNERRNSGLIRVLDQNGKFIYIRN